MKRITVIVTHLEFFTVCARSRPSKDKHDGIERKNERIACKPHTSTGENQVAVGKKNAMMSMDHHGR